MIQNNLDANKRISQVYPTRNARYRAMSEFPSISGSLASESGLQKECSSLLRIEGPEPTLENSRRLYSLKKLSRPQSFKIFFKASSPSDCIYQPCFNRKDGECTTTSAACGLIKFSLSRENNKFPQMKVGLMPRFPSPWASALTTGIL